MMIPRAATPDDFAFIRGLAGHPDYAPFITDEDEASLALYLADPSARLQIWQENGQPAGFALFARSAIPRAGLNCAALHWRAPVVAGAWPLSPP